jgi:hypothetical protein
MKLLEKPSLEFGSILTRAETTGMDFAPFCDTAFRKKVLSIYNNAYLQ